MINFEPSPHARHTILAIVLSLARDINRHYFDCGLNPSNAGTYFRRQNMKSISWRIKSIPALKGLNSVKVYNGSRLTTQVFEWSGKSLLRHLWWFQIEKSMQEYFSALRVKPMLGWCWVSVAHYTDQCRRRRHPSIKPEAVQVSRLHLLIS